MAGLIKEPMKAVRRKEKSCPLSPRPSGPKSDCRGAARLAWGSVGPTVVTAAVVEDAQIGEKLSQEILATVAGRIRQIVAPINDVRASADYRRTVSGNLLLRLLDARPQI
jgi:CO/xanthine dehydrogenase FAD-binding subunit